MDVFVEQLVRRKKSGKDYAMVAGVIVLGIFLLTAALMVPFLVPFQPFLIAGVCFGVYYVNSMRNLEFEYSTTNGDFTIDQITNRRSRKRICSFDLKMVEEMGRYNADALRGKSFGRQLKVGTDDAGTDAWYLIVRLKDSGSTLILLNPDERMLGAMKSFLPRQVSVHAYRGN